MTTFFRLLADEDKQKALSKAMRILGENVFEVDPASFLQIPGAPFAYWISESLLNAGKNFENFEPNIGTVRVGVQTDDDPRFVRLWWEPRSNHDGSTSESISCWVPFLKGEASGKFYLDHIMVINWGNNGVVLKAATQDAPGGRVNNEVDFYKPGLSWAVRTAKFSPHIVPQGCIPSVSRYLALPEQISTLALMGLWNSIVIDQLCKLRMERFGHPKFIVGVIKTLPTPIVPIQTEQTLSWLSSKAWRFERMLASTIETSYSFLLPEVLRNRVGGFCSRSIEDDIESIQEEIDNISFALYGFSEFDRAVSIINTGAQHVIEGCEEDEDEETISAEPEPPLFDALLSWAVGVAFGRFDWRLATGEREELPEPNPFDPLPAKSPGMLPDGAAPFHTHAGILVDDQGHPHDLARLIEEVLSRVEVPVPEDARRWLQREFFAFHLQGYSKSRRKAPIYWPLSTTSGSYTLWVYYPSLTSQTLYTAINDFAEPKLQQVGAVVVALRNKGSTRTRDDDKQFEALQALELELIELRDTLLKLASTYKPKHDDGVQISAAPLWPLFRSKPWQKVLKDTWIKLEKGDYDWAHLALNYWPERVREKCKTDKSLAIAHGLEDIYKEPEASAKKAHGRKKIGSDE